MAVDQQQKMVEQEILKAERSRCDALMSRDARVLDGHYTNDFVYVHSSGRKEERVSYLDTVTTTDNTFLSFKHSDLKVDALGAGAALLTGTVEMERRNGTVVFLFVEVWVRSNGGWQLKYQHNTKKAA
jgi:hypothetical protein